MAANTETEKWTWLATLLPWSFVVNFLALAAAGAPCLPFSSLCPTGAC